MDNISIIESNRPFRSKIFSIRLLVRDAFVTSMIISMIAVIIHDAQSFSSLLLVLIIGIGYTLGFAINDYFDRDVDVNDRSKAQNNFFVYNSNKLGLTILCTLFLFLLVIAVSYAFKGLFVYFIAIIAFWTYSAKPFRFKNRPGIDLLIHGTFIETYPYFVTLYLLNFEVKSIDYLMMSILCLNSMINQIGQQLRDYDVDLLRETNFTIKIGPSTSKTIYRVMSGFIVILPLMALKSFTENYILLPTIVFLLPIFFLRFLSDYDTNKPHRIYDLTLAIVFLYLLGAVLVNI